MLVQDAGRGGQSGVAYDNQSASQTRGLQQVRTISAVLIMHT